MHQVLGVLEVVPAPPAESGEERADVLRLEYDQSAGAQQRSRALQGGDGIGEVLEHVPEADQVEAVRREAGLLESLGEHPLAPVTLARRAGDRLRGFDPDRVPAFLHQHVQEVPRRAADVERAPRGGQEGRDPLPALPEGPAVELGVLAVVGVAALARGDGAPVVLAVDALEARRALQSRRDVGEPALLADAHGVGIVPEAKARGARSTERAAHLLVRSGGARRGRPHPTSSSPATGTSRRDPTRPTCRAAARPISIEWSMLL